MYTDLIKHAVHSMPAPKNFGIQITEWERHE